MAPVEQAWACASALRARMLETMNAQMQTLPRKLTDREQMFADNYLATPNATQSAIDAGFAASSAHVTASRLLRKPNVAEYIASQRAARSAVIIPLQDKIKAELEAMAFINIEDLTTLGEDGQRFVDFSKATRAQLAGVTKITNKRRKVYNAKGEQVAEETEHAFTLADKYRGLELLGRVTGMFKAEENRVIVDVADRLLSARQRILNVTDVKADDAE